MGQYRVRKKVRDMSAVVRKEESRERKLAELRDVSAKVTEAAIKAGISHQELEESAYRAFQNVKRRRHSGCTGCN